MPPSVCRACVVVDALRLVGQIAAGQHDGPIDLAQQQVMQRRVRQHDAERAEAGRDRFAARAGHRRAAAG